MKKYFLPATIVLFIVGICLSQQLDIRQSGGGGGGGTWGSIGGNLSDQTDLKSALDSKVSGSTNWHDQASSSATLSGTATMGAAGISGTLTASNILGSVNRVINVTASPYNATGNGTTDDSAAIQAAINAITNTGGTIYFPRGIYKVAAAFHAVTGAYSATQVQLDLPVLSLQSNSSICIKLMGDPPPAPNVNWTTNHQPVSTGGSIILSTNVASNASYTIIGNSGPPGGWLFNAITLDIENLTFRTYSNPKITPLNLTYVGQVILNNILVDTGVDLGSTVYPTNLSTGIIMPIVNNWAKSIFNNIDIVGYNTGMSISEHCDGDNVGIWQCHNAFYLPGSYHPLRMGRTLVVGCGNGVIAGGAQAITWNLYDVEHTTQIDTNRSWMNTVLDISDESNVLTGSFNYAAVTSTTGATTNNMRFFGARELITTDLNSKPSSTTLLNQLLGYWKLDETTGNRLDSSGLQNSLLPVGAVSFSTGVISNAASFSGSSVNLAVASDDGTLVTGEVPFTLSCWVKFNDVTGQKYVLTKGTVSNWDYAIDINAGKLRFWGYDGVRLPLVTANSAGSVATNTWYHVVGWNDQAGGTVNIQVNGGTVDSVVKGTNTFATSVSTFKVGGLSPYLNGLADEVGMWKRVLTSGERSYLYNSGSGNTYPFQ